MIEVNYNWIQNFVDKKLKELESTAKILSADNAVAIALTAQYRYLTSLKASLA